MKGRDLRAQAVVLTSIIVFGFVVASVGVLQVYLVPAMNSEVEYEHNLAIQEDLSHLDEAVVRAAYLGKLGSVNVHPEVRYPPRFVLLNPPPAGGSFQTESLGDIGLSNVALSDERGVYYTGELGPFETKGLRFVPRYNEYQQAPETVYENRVLYNEFAGGQQLSVDERSFIAGNRLSLLAVSGDIDVADGSTYAVNVVPVSTTTQSTYLTNSTSGPVTVTLPTRLSDERWTDVLEPELVSNGGYVTGHSVADGVLTVTLQAGVEYEVRLAHVGLGAVDPEDPDALVGDYALVGEAGHRIVTVDGTTEAVPASGSQKMVVEVRDRFTNPVKGVEVKSTDIVAVGDVVPVRPSKTDPTVGVTDENGRAEFVLRAPIDAGVETTSVKFLIETDVELLTVSPPLVTSADDVVVTGTATGGSALDRVEVSLGDDTTTYANVNIPQASLVGDGFTATLPVPVIADGVYDVKAVAVTTDGTEFDTLEADAVTVDNTLPTLTIDDIDKDKAKAGTVITVALSVGDANGVDETTVELVDASGTVVASETYTGAVAEGTLTVPTLAADGFYDVRATATDAAGNVNTVTVTDVVDVSTSMAKVVEYVSGSAATKVGDDSAVVFSIRNDAANEVVVTDLKVKVKDGDADILLERQLGSGPWTTEIFVDATVDGAYDSVWGSYALNTEVSVSPSARLAAGETADIYLFRFYERDCEKEDGFLQCEYDDEEMDGVTLEVTFYFEDGSKNKMKFTV